MTMRGCVQVGTFGLADMRLMYGLEVNRGGATVIFAGLAVAMLTGGRLTRIRGGLREILPDYHDAEEIPRIEGHFERKYGETQAELAAIRRKYRETQAELAAVQCELGEVRSRYERELDEPPRKRARV